MIPKLILILLIIPSNFTFNYDSITEMLSKLFLNQQSENRQPKFNQSSPKENNEEIYDFIIVGSGNAGSVLANRLSEIPTWRILLLEVGAEPTFLTDIPAIAPLFQFTNLNWNYLMQKQNNVALGMVDQRMAWPRGKSIGGSSVINYMIHTRGNQLDFENWAKSNPGWSYQNVLKYYLKSENAQLANQDRGYHSTGGTLSISDIPYRTESAEIFVKASQEIGYPQIDYNGKQQLGVSYVQSTTINGKRCSAGKAFLTPVKHRTNLVISPMSRVIKILINPQKKATGVIYIKNRKYFKAYARKEVIISAGAFNSPQLLMLSGVGPKQHLDQLGITTIQDLPVGRKLYDHLTFPGVTFTINQSIVSNQEDLQNPKSIYDWLVKGTGPLTSLGGVEALLYIKTNISQEVNNNPDIEFIFISGSFSTDKGEYYRKTFRIKNEIYEKIWKPLENANTWTALPMLLHPKSYGYLELQSKNPYQFPKLYGNYFTDSENQDIRTFVAAIYELQKICQAPTFQRFNCKLVDEPILGCEGYKFNSEGYWECALRHLATTLHHQVATCKMGVVTDHEAVVDHELRVHGIGNLRVVDTSVIPIPLSAHTSSPAYMVGEKAADLIKKAWLQL